MASYSGFSPSGNDVALYLAKLLTSPDKLAIVVLSLLISYSVVLVYLRPRKDLPPGPTPIPFFGNALQVTTEKSWLYFHSLCEKYGPIVRLSLAGTDMVILDELEDIEELLVKRSNNYSSRQQLVYGGKYRSADKRLVLLPYGPQLKKQRAAVFQMLNARVVGGYEHIQERGAMKLLSDILKTPTKAYISIKRYTAETLLMLVYGKGFGEDVDDLRRLLHILETFIQDMHPFAHPVDMFPVLDLLPNSLAKWRSEAREKHNDEAAFYTRLLKEVKQRLDNGESLECFAARLWEGVEKFGLDELSMAYVAGSAFEAGTDNTAGSILWFLVCIMHYPATMKKAQAELDAAVGPEGYTPPGFQHLEQLPYCVALVKEVFRWMPVAPVGGPPRQIVKEDVYKGYRFAPGTLVVGNTWAIHHNEKLYPDPFMFKPERFMPTDGRKVGPESLNEGHYGFGFGRRTCPGQYLASKSVWIGVVRLLWAFNITPPSDASGSPILPDKGAFRPGITAEPDTFDVTLTPRSKVHAQTIVQAWGS